MTKKPIPKVYRIVCMGENKYKVMLADINGPTVTFIDHYPFMVGGSSVQITHRDYSSAIDKITTTTLENCVRFIKSQYHSYQRELKDYECIKNNKTIIFNQEDGKFRDDEGNVVDM